jgi:hypothetical protein
MAHGAGASFSARVIAPSPAADSASPVKSMRCVACSSKLSAVRRTPIRITAPTITFSHRIQRHDASCVKTPPIAGPIPENSAVAAPQTPTAIPRCSPRKPSVTIASEAGVRTAAPTPTPTRPTINTVALPASAAGTDAAMYRIVPQVSRRTRPNTSANRPAAISSAE